jgi:hypothetical protein
MNIFKPTDFSKLSKIAFYYAIKIVKKLYEEIVLQYVICIVAPPRAMVAVKVR